GTRPESRRDATWVLAYGLAGVVPDGTRVLPSTFPGSHGPGVPVPPLRGWLLGIFYTFSLLRGWRLGINQLSPSCGSSSSGRRAVLACSGRRRLMHRLSSLAGLLLRRSGRSSPHRRPRAGLCELWRKIQ